MEDGEITNKMIDIENKENCCGCSGCETICPVSAIRMEADSKGFKYPRVDPSICIRCGLCIQVCPMPGKRETPDIRPASDVKVFAYKEKSVRKRMKSQSGGGFAGLAKFWMERERDAVIYGVCLAENLKAEYTGISTIRDLPCLSGSKYVQADLAPVQSDVLSALKKGRYVLFCGTPCYVSSIKRMAHVKRLNTDRLLLVDFVCHGVTSPVLYEEYLEYLERKIGSKILDFRFRDKRIGGWGAYWSTAYAENGLTYCTKEYLDYYHHDSYARDSCYSCPYASKNRNSDLTLADYWSIGDVRPDFYDLSGVSCVIASTPKGKKAGEALVRYGHILETGMEDAMQRPLTKPLARPASMDEDWERYENGGIEAILKKEQPVPIWRGIPLTAEWGFLREFYWAKIRRIEAFRNMKRRIDALGRLL